MLLRMRDVQAQLQDKWLQLYWPDDSRWWPAQVTHVNAKRNRALLLYETGQPLLAWLVWRLLAGDSMIASAETCCCCSGLSSHAVHLV